MAIVIYTHGLDALRTAFDRKRPETGNDWSLEELHGNDCTWAPIGEHLH